MIPVRILGSWLVLLLVMAVNGAVRDALLLPRLGEHRANQLSVLSGCCVIALLTLLLRGVWPLDRPWTTGVSWLALTVAFEFLFFHFVTGHPWSELVANYDLTRGRLFPLALTVTLLAPPAVSRLVG